MNIIYGNMKMHNFMSYADEEFDWSSKTYNGINLITGVNKDIAGVKNGSGKSTLFAALYYAIYGSIPSLGPQIKNPNIKNMFVPEYHMYVSLDVNTDGVQYKIISGMKDRGNRAYCKLYKADPEGNFEDITKSSIDETRNFIVREIVGADEDTFMYTTLLKNDISKNFFLMKPTEMKTFLENVFDIHHFKDMGDKIKSYENAAKNDLAIVDARIMDLNNNEDVYTRENEKFESTKAENIKILEERLKKATSDYEARKAEYLEVGTKKIGDYETRLNGERTKIENKRAILSNVNGEIAVLKTSRDQKNASAARIKNYIGSWNNAQKEMCDDCKPLCDKYAKLGHWNKSYEDAMKEVGKIDEEIARKQDEAGKISDMISSMEQTYKKMRTEYLNIRNRQTEAVNNMRAAENIKISVERDLENQRKSVNTYGDLLLKCKTDRELLEKKAAELKHDIIHYAFGQKIVSKTGMEKYAMSNMIQALNYDISGNLKPLGVDYSITITEDMEYHFTNAAEGAKPQFGNFSSGEQARILIASILTFKKFLSEKKGIHSNILIIDEYIDGKIDEVAIMKILERLKKISETSKQNIFVVSHRQEIKSDSFNTIIEIQKKNHISSIKVV